MTLTACGNDVHQLENWSLLPTRPGKYSKPFELPREGWLFAEVPGTVASSATHWSINSDFARSAAEDADGYDWWYRCQFNLDEPEGQAAILRFQGLATVAAVWLNGYQILRSDNMFTSQVVELRKEWRRSGSNELYLCFSAIEPLLADRRMPKAKWRTKLVGRQELRWIRTTLVGRMPGWSAGPAPVGPWRAITLETSARFVVVQSRVSSRLDRSDGVVDAAIKVVAAQGQKVRSALLDVGGLTGPADGGDGGEVKGRLVVRAADRWYPHTHGGQPLSPVKVVLHLDDGSFVDVGLGNTGFRSIELENGDNRFALKVNGIPIFFRGACWSPLDPVALAGTPDEYRGALTQLRDAGGNMVRLCGHSYYELAEFYSCCDELGIVIWQDMMFANMDYPFGDPAFRTAVEEEVTQVLSGLSIHPSVGVICGNSEVEQQAAFVGVPLDPAATQWFAGDLAALSADLVPGVPYWRSSPTGDALPMRADAGDSHYQGVGALLRPLDDAILSGVLFASECLALANPPEPAPLLSSADSAVPINGPIWKSGTARDNGVGWDFDDVRDSYLSLLLGVDPLEVRYQDPERYLALSRLTTGELMFRVFSDWRSRWSPCMGGLVWLWRDLHRGTGWGIVDWRGEAKSVYYFLKRAWQVIAVWIVDRGVNGLWAVAVNDSGFPIEATLRISVYPRGALRPIVFANPIRMGAHSDEHVQLEIVTGFRDLNHVFRFGPRGYDATMVELIDEGTGRVLSENIFSHQIPVPAEISDFSATTEWCCNESLILTLEGSKLLWWVWVQIPGMYPDDNYFHLAPGCVRRVTFRRNPELRAHARGATPAVGQIGAMNVQGTYLLTVDTQI